MLPVFQEHKEPVIGQIIDIKVTEKGVWVAAGVWQEVSQRSFSFGFNVLESYQKNYLRFLKKINIKEISLVFFPAQEDTQCKKIKMKQD